MNKSNTLRIRACLRVIAPRNTKLIAVQESERSASNFASISNVLSSAVKGYVRIQNLDFCFRVMSD